MRATLQTIRKYSAKGNAVAVATIISASGSSPRAVGAKMVIADDMQFSGSVSGGCVESAVIQEALQVMASGIPKLLFYGITDSLAQSVGLACGGEIEVWVEPIVDSPDKPGISTDLLNVMEQIVTEERSFLILTFLEGKSAGQKTLYTEQGIQLLDNQTIIFSEEALHLMQQVFAQGQSQCTLIKQDDKETRLFAEYISPQRRLIIIGAVHIAVALSKFAKELGFTSIVIDPRKAFATLERLSSADQIVKKWPEEALREIKLRATDCVAVISHDEKIDIPALNACLKSSVNYIGLLGSRKTRAERFNVLKQQGVSEQDLERIHAPIGLDIGARNPEEIALSIMAEIIHHQRANTT